MLQRDHNYKSLRDLHESLQLPHNPEDLKYREIAHAYWPMTIAYGLWYERDLSAEETLLFNDICERMVLLRPYYDREFRREMGYPV